MLGVCLYTNFTTKLGSRDSNVYERSRRALQYLCLSMHLYFALIRRYNTRKLDWESKKYINAAEGLRKDILRLNRSEVGTATRLLLVAALPTSFHADGHVTFSVKWPIDFQLFLRPPHQRQKCQELSATCKQPWALAATTIIYRDTSRHSGVNKYAAGILFGS